MEFVDRRGQQLARLPASANSDAPSAHSAVFTNRLGRDTIRSTLVAQLHPTTRARLRLVPVLVQLAAIRRYVASVGLEWAPKWGMTKVLAHELLPDCFEWLLVLDADVMLAGDVRELWHLRHAFNATQLLGGYREYTYNAASLAKLRKTFHGESPPCPRDRTSRAVASHVPHSHTLFWTLTLELAFVDIPPRSPHACADGERSGWYTYQCRT